MLWMYLRIIVIVCIVFLTYAAGVYYFPSVGNKIDSTLWTEMNKNLSLKIDNLFQKSQEAWDAFNNKLDNPAPNTSKKIEERSTNQ